MKVFTSVKPAHLRVSEIIVAKPSGLPSGLVTKLSKPMAKKIHQSVKKTLISSMKEQKSAKKEIKEIKTRISLSKSKTRETQEVDFMFGSPKEI